MSRRAKIAIAVLILLLLIAFAIWLALSRRAVPGPAGIENVALNGAQANVNRGGLPGGGTTINVNAPGGAANVNGGGTVAPAPDPALALRRLASSFAERYGSFSNLGDFENLTDLKVFMSASFAASTDAFVARERAKPTPSEYRGFTTRALSTEVVSLDDSAGTAVITVKTQRQEFTDPTAPGTVSYQDIRLGFIKEGGTWKVDSATWQ
jgi:hypothetical protein